MKTRYRLIHRGRGNGIFYCADSKTGKRTSLSRKEITLDLRRPDSFDFARPRQIEVAPGDKVLIRANDKQLGLTNGQVLTISGAAPDGALQTKEGLCVPADFRQWCHGYVVI
jgi:hypothetical protein